MKICAICGEEFNFFHHGWVFSLYENSKRYVVYACSAKCYKGVCDPESDELLLQDKNRD